MTFEEYVAALNETIQAAFIDEVTFRRDTGKSVVKWEVYDRRVSAQHNADTQIWFRKQADVGIVEPLGARDDLAAPQIKESAEMVVAFLKAKENNGWKRGSKQVALPLPREKSVTVFTG
jgi:hypothetical protein